MQSVKKLKETQLVQYESEGDGELCSTEFGDVMSRVSFTVLLVILVLNARHYYSLVLHPAINGLWISHSDVLCLHVFRQTR